jgi:hypothetical protein
MLTSRDIRFLGRIEKEGEWLGVAQHPFRIRESIQKLSLGKIVQVFP